MAADGSSSKIRFQLRQEVPFKTYFKVCGSLEELGAWNLDQAPAMEWNDGDVWTLDIAAPPGTEVEYKLVKIPRREPIKWEGGINRALKAPEDDVIVDLPQFDSCPTKVEMTVSQEVLAEHEVTTEPQGLTVLPARAATVAVAYVTDVIMESPGSHTIASEVVECAGLLPTAVYMSSLQEPSRNAGDLQQNASSEDGFFSKLMFWKS